MPYQCPVCGYAELPAPAEDFEICVSCGTEFGVHDWETSHEQLRLEWLLDGAQWFAQGIQEPPAGWDGIEQLTAAGLLPIVMSDSAAEHTAHAGDGYRMNVGDLVAA